MNEEMKKSYVDIKDVKQIKMPVSYIKCPKCKKELQGVSGYDLEFIEREIKDEGRTRFDISEARRNADEEGKFWACFCGHVFPRDLDNLWDEKMVDGLECPVCQEEVSKTGPNFTWSGTGFACPKGHGVLEYVSYPSHGSGKVKVHSTTDYFHGECPNCKPDKGYGMMILGDQIWVEPDGRVILSLFCRNCGYRDTIKMHTEDGHPAPKVSRKYTSSYEPMP